MLMGEPFASHHDGFLRRYMDKAELAERQGRAILSNIVGSGRDVIAKHRDGSSRRMFLMVERVDRSTSVYDCLFVGTMVSIPDGEPSNVASERHSSQVPVRCSCFIVPSSGGLVLTIGVRPAPSQGALAQSRGGGGPQRPHSTPKRRGGASCGGRVLVRQRSGTQARIVFEQTGTWCRPWLGDVLWTRPATPAAVPVDQTAERH